MLITPDQIRAARALKGWSQGELANRTGLAVPTIANIEIGKQEPSTKTLQKILDAFQIGGIKFTEHGVEFDRNEFYAITGEGKFKYLLNDIEITLSNSDNKEMLFLYADDSRSTEEEIEVYKKLHEKGITHRDIACNQHSLFHQYKNGEMRAIDELYFDSAGAVIIYDDKVAFYTATQKEKPAETIIINNKRIADNYRCIFEFFWAHGDQVPASKKKKAGK